MMVKRISDDEFSITATAGDLIVLGNCLNEVCHGIALFEFETRLGATKEEVRRMLDKIRLR
jgi:hypothetical protein